MTRLNVTVITAAIGLLCALPRTAAAQPPSPTWTPQPAPTNQVMERTDKYGSQIVLADLASVAFMVAVINTGGAGDLSLFSALSFATFSPTVHFVHGNVEGGVGSIVLHVMAPILGASIGYQVDFRLWGKDEFLPGFGGFVIGGLVGAVSATALDAIVLAQKTTREPVVPRAYSLAPRVSVLPHGGFSLGLGGTM